MLEYVELLAYIEFYNLVVYLFFNYFFKEKQRLKHTKLSSFKLFGEGLLLLGKWLVPMVNYYLELTLLCVACHLKKRTVWERHLVSKGLGYSGTNSLWQELIVAEGRAGERSSCNDELICNNSCLRDSLSQLSA